MEALKQNPQTVSRDLLAHLGFYHCEETNAGLQIQPSFMALPFSLRTVTSEFFYRKKKYEHTIVIKAKSWKK